MFPPTLPAPLPSRLTLGAVARHFGVPVWKVRRLFERGLLPPAERVAGLRVVAPTELPVVAAALCRAGYLPGPPSHTAPTEPTDGRTA